MKRAGLLALPLALAACTTPRPPAEPGLARLGQTVTVGPIQVTPYQLLEDSRCPLAVQCVWAGRVRIMARLSLAARELTMGQPVPVAGGALMLAEVQPARRPETEIAPSDYRFRFAFEPAH